MKFTGHERDFHGWLNVDNDDYLDYMHARYYDPNLGRFLSVDPTWDSAELERPQTWNRYAYVLNNPVNMRDPDGRCGRCIAALFELQVYVSTHPDEIERAARTVLALVTFASEAEVADEVVITDTAGTDTSPLEGVYTFPDAQSPGDTYVGQSSNIPNRLNQHENSGKKDPNDPATAEEVKGGKTAREHAEQNKLNELGGKRGTPGSQASNKVNPIGPKRAPTVEEVYGPIKPPRPKVIPEPK